MDDTSVYENKASLSFCLYLRNSGPEASRDKVMSEYQCCSATTRAFEKAQDFLPDRRDKKYEQ
jgi:hypothetical protein